MVSRGAENSLFQSSEFIRLSFLRTHGEGNCQLVLSESLDLIVNGKDRQLVLGYGGAPCCLCSRLGGQCLLLLPSALSAPKETASPCLGQ